MLDETVPDPPSDAALWCIIRSKTGIQLLVDHPACQIG